MNLVEQNNTAAALIRDGRFTDAYSQLRLALEEETVVLEQQQQHEGNEERAVSVNATLQTTRPTLMSLAIIPSFSSPLVMINLPNNSSCDVWSAEFHACASATAIFNMGLACYRYAEENHHTQYQHHRITCQAQACFQHALDLINNNTITTIPPILHLALCHNSAQIARDQGHAEIANMWESHFAGWLEILPYFSSTVGEAGGDTDFSQFLELQLPSLEIAARAA